MAIQAHKGLSLDQIRDAYMNNPDEFVEAANEEKRTLDSYLNTCIPEADVLDGHDVLDYILGKEELYISGNNGASATDVQRFFDKKAPRQLAWAVLQRDYDNVLGLNCIENNKSNYNGKLKHMVAREFALREAAASGELPLRDSTGNTETELVPGTAANPRALLPVVDLRKYRPPIAISDIAGFIQTISGNSYHQVQDNTPAAEQMVRSTTETGELDVSKLTFTEKTGELRKVGRGLEFSKRALTNTAFIDGLRRWVMKIALRSETAMVNVGLDIMYKSIAGRGATFEGVGASPDRSSIIEVNLHRGSGNAYLYNLLVMRQEDAQVWIDANVNANVGTAIAPAGRFTSVFPGVELVNNVQGPTRVAYIGDTEIDGWANNHFIGVDQREALTLIRVLGGNLDEQDYDPQTTVYRRFISQLYDWNLEDPNAVTGWQYL